MTIEADSRYSGGTEKTTANPGLSLGGGLFERGVERYSRKQTGMQAEDAGGMDLMEKLLEHLQGQEARNGMSFKNAETWGRNSRTWRLKWKAEASSGVEHSKQLKGK